MKLPQTLEKQFKDEYQFFGCTTGDCPHQTQEECNLFLIGEGAIAVLEQAENLARAVEFALIYDPQTDTYKVKHTAYPKLKQALAEYKLWKGE